MEKFLKFRPLTAYLEPCETSMMELFANIHDSLVVHYFLRNVKIIHVSRSSEGVSEIYLIIVTYCMHWKVSILEQPSAVLFLLWLHKSRERTSSVAILELFG